MKLLLPDPAALQFDALSPLEEGLRGEQADAVRAQTLALLRDLEQRTRAAMRAGALPDRYRELVALLDACLAAQDALGTNAAPPSSMGASVRLA